jgi:hypothetical protein
VLERVEEGLALGPGRGRDNHARGVAVEAGVVGEHRRQVRGLVAQLRRGPAPGNDDHRRDVAALDRHRDLNQTLAARFARRAVGTRPEHDRLEGLVRPGHVDVADVGMAGEVGAGGGVAGDDP